MKATEQFNFYEDSKRFLIILTDGNDEEPEKLTKIKDKLSGMGIHSIAVGHNHAGRHVSVNIFFLLLILVEIQLGGCRLGPNCPKPS